MVARATPKIHVLAGVNGAGKSSIGGAAIREAGGEYYNPDEVARQLRAQNRHLRQSEANAKAWQTGKLLLERAIRERLDFAFETTLGAATLPSLLLEAARSGFEIHIWYAGLATAEQHIERVKTRVRFGGHDIPEADIRRRFDKSRLNLVSLLPIITSLRLFDNSRDANPQEGREPEPLLLLHVENGRIRSHCSPALTPTWAKPIIVAALKALAERPTRGDSASQRAPALLAACDRPNQAQRQ